MLLTTIHLSPTTLIWSFFTFIGLYFFYKLIIAPYLLIRYYKKQGAITKFNWKLLSLFDKFKNAAEKGDFYYDDKQIFKANPGARFMATNFTSKVALALYDLEMVKEFLKKHEIYQKEKQIIGILIDLAGRSTIFAEGHVWKRGRRIISSAFNYEFLKNVVPLIAEVTQEKFNDWIANGNLKDMDILTHLATITGEITGRFFFGKRFGDRKIDSVSMTIAGEELLRSNGNELMSLTGLIFGMGFMKLNILPRHKRINRMIAEFRGHCIDMIQEVKESKNKESNLLKVLLDLGEADKVESRLTDEQIIGEFIGLLGAGTDTTSHLVNSALYFLWKHPEACRKVKEEADQVFKDISTLNVEDINKMEYTTAFLKETLRLGGPISCFFPRVAVQDDDLCGVKVKKGTMVQFYHEIYFSSETYFENPKEFIPERWLSDNLHTQNALKTDPYAFIPFSAGPRNCVGQHLAMIEARIIIGLFVKTFNFKFSEAYRLRLVQRFLYEPLEPLVITLEPKEVAH